MMEILFWVFLGCVVGIFTGLVPGVHVNTVAMLVLFFPGENSFFFAMMIVAMSVVHSFIDFIPSILLGAVDAESFLAVLPGHRLMLNGFGLYAIKLTVIGGLLAGVFSLIFLPVFSLFIAKFVEGLYFFIPLILFGVLGAMVLSEQYNKRWACITIVLSGFLGVVVLLGNLPVRNSLFPLVTGFFAAASLLYSLKSISKIPEQKIENSKYEGSLVFKGSFLSMVAGSIVAVMPSIGPSQAAFVVRKLVGKISNEMYLVVLGGINTVNIIFSFFVLYLIGKTRSGVAAVAKQLVVVDVSFLFMVIGVVVFALGFGAIAADVVSKKAVYWIGRIDYRKMTVLTLVGIAGLCFVLSGVWGFGIFVIAGAVGLIPISANIKRTHSMAFLMLPTIIIYLSM